MNEISSPPNDTDMVLNNEAEIIALAFEEIFKTLEMKKQQLTEDLENQRRKKEKEFQIWKKMKETHKKTIENLLNDCEKLVHECDPQHFLEVMVFSFLSFFFFLTWYQSYSRVHILCSA